MWIKPVKKKDRKGQLKYTYYRLMQSIRTPAGVKHRTILNLGNLQINKEKYKDLANRIEEITLGQKNVFAPIDQDIEPLATHYASLIIEKELILKKVINEEESEPKFEKVNISSLKNTHCRTIGGEHLCLSTFKQLKLDKYLKTIGFTTEQINLTAAMITGRLLSPGSERATKDWIQNISGIGELLGTDYKNLSNNAPYRISDLLLKHKLDIEQHLQQQEEKLFSLNSKIILYDLTNTYIEGKGKDIAKASFGRSKEKRSDCLLITLGLIIDENGFPKGSRIMDGNVSEPSTLLSMIKEMESLETKTLNKGKKTVLIDAGIATKDNLLKLKESGYDYVCVSRNKPIELSEIDSKGSVIVKEDKHNKVEVTMATSGDETILYCKSNLKRKKEQAMKTKYQERFEVGLATIESSLNKARGMKKYDQILKRIGRVIEKHKRVARFYEITVTEDKESGNAASITWKRKNEELLNQNFAGSYFLKTSRTDLSEQEIWSLYITLNQVEDAFRAIKTDLEARPIYHRKGKRVDGHLFIVILAYHLLNTIRYQLKSRNINLRFSSIRKRLSTHTVVTTSFTNEAGRRIHIRNCVEAEPLHTVIYDALGISHVPLKPVNTVL